MASDCGVSAISGKSRMTPLPLARTSSIRRSMTLVFPLPVTPCNSAACAFPVPNRSDKVRYAASCSSFSTMGEGFATVSTAYGLRSTLRTVAVRIPFSVSARSWGLPASDTAEISSAHMPSGARRSSSSTAFCFGVVLGASISARTSSCGRASV